MNAAQIDRRQARISRTYTDICKRMQGLGVRIDNFIDETRDFPVRAWNHPLAGIEFDIRPFGSFGLGAMATGRQQLLMALDGANNGGRKRFRRGKVEKNPHLPVDFSMKFTDGMGFREIYYFDADHVSDTRRRIDTLAPRPNGFDHGFSAKFGGGPKRIDISSLHVAVADEVCGIHVDETGFVFEPLVGTGGDVWVSLEALQHTVYELLARDLGNVPANIKIYVPNANNNYSRAGVRGTAHLTQQLRVVVDKSARVNLPTFWAKPKEYSFTISLSGEFN